jgi:hypothetical protein
LLLRPVGAPAGTPPPRRGRSSVTLKKKRSAATVALILWADISLRIGQRSRQGYRYLSRRCALRQVVGRSGDRRHRQHRRERTPHDRQPRHEILPTCLERDGTSQSRQTSPGEPFAAMGLQSSNRETPTATFAELQAFRAMAIEMGYPFAGDSRTDRLGMASARGGHLRHVRGCALSAEGASKRRPRGARGGVRLRDARRPRLHPAREERGPQTARAGVA